MRGGWGVRGQHQGTQRQGTVHKGKKRAVRALLKKASTQPLQGLGCALHQAKAGICERKRSEWPEHHDLRHTHTQTPTNNMTSYQLVRCSSHDMQHKKGFVLDWFC